MANQSTSRLLELASAVDEHLHHFADDDDGGRRLDPEDYVNARKKRKKRRETGAAVGATAAAGAAGAGFAKRKQIARAGKDAAFKGMRKTAGAMNSAGNTANRAAKKVGKGGEVGKTLKKGAKALRKNSMKLFEEKRRQRRDLARRMDRVLQRLDSLDA